MRRVITASPDAVFARGCSISAVRAISAAASSLINFLLILVAPALGLLWLALMPFTQGFSRRGLALVTLENFRTVLHSTFYVDLVWQTLLMSAGAATCVMALTICRRLARGAPAAGRAGCSISSPPRR